MTLDHAKEAFDHAPSYQACSDFLRAAVEYHIDGMIEDNTLHLRVERVAEWLADR